MTLLLLSTHREFSDVLEDWFSVGNAATVSLSDQRGVCARIESALGMRDGLFDSLCPFWNKGPI